MKTVCAWCGRILKDDADAKERVSHGICPACYDQEVRPFVEAQAPAGKIFEPSPQDFDWFAFLQGQMLLGFIAAVIWFIAVMTAESLHWATGGKVPQLIDWHPDPHTPHVRRWP